MTFSVRVLKDGWPKRLEFSPPLTNSSKNTHYYLEEKQEVEKKLLTLSKKYKYDG